jgi:hypothetical protein
VRAKSPRAFPGEGLCDVKEQAGEQDARAGSQFKNARHLASRTAISDPRPSAFLRGTGLRPDSSGLCHAFRFIAPKERPRRSTGRTVAIEIVRRFCCRGPPIPGYLPDAGPNRIERVGCRSRGPPSARVHRFLAGVTGLSLFWAGRLCKS